MLKPAFDKNNVAICMSSSNYYVPYLTVALSSLVAHINNENNYDIIILTTSITEENKKILTNLLSAKNVSIRFYNPKEYFQDIKALYTCDHLSFETYFKLSIPLFMQEYKKVLFLDSDIVVNCNLAELYNTDLGQYPIGACKCLIMQSLSNTFPDWKHYLTETLNLNNPEKYFQGGVLLINVQEWLKYNYSEKLIDSVQNNNFRIVDQCALNKLFKDNYYQIDNEYNIETLQKCFLPHTQNISYDFRTIINNIRKQPCIIHYAGKDKPWIYPDEEYANIWWQYAQRTPFYELIIKNMIDQVVDNKIKLNYSRINTNISAVKNYRKNVLKYWRAKLCSKLYRGKKKQHYIEKCNHLKTLIRIAKGYK